MALLWHIDFGGGVAALVGGHQALGDLVGGSPVAVSRGSRVDPEGGAGIGVTKPGWAVLGARAASLPTMFCLPVLGRP